MRGLIQKPLGRVLVAIAVLASAGAIVVPAVTPGGGGGETCNSSVSTRAALLTALASTANSGQTVCVTANITGGNIDITADFTTQARFVAQPNNMTVDLPSVSFTGAHKVTIEGFEMTSGGFFVNNGTSSGDVLMKKNYLHAYADNGYRAGGGITHTNIQIVGNRLECITFDPAAGNPSGYGIFNDADGTMTIRYNSIVGCNNTADGMQISNLDGADISYNEVRNIHWDGLGGDPHADAIMLWAGLSNATVTNNRLLDSTGTLMSPDMNDVTFTNNLIVNHFLGSAQCVDSTANGTSGAVSPLRHTWQQNTIWACGNGGINMNQATGSRGSNVADRNLATSVQCASATVWSSQNNHNIVDSDPGNCWPGATNRHGFTPTWANTSDPASPSYYIPTNLPTGYEDVGYTYVPAGYTACSC